MHPDYEYDRELHETAKLLAEQCTIDGGSFVINTLAHAYLDLLERRGLPPSLKCYPSIQLQSGVFYDFLDPDSTPIHPEDIASGLSKQTRCTGQTLGTEIYSIAQHCCHAHDMADRPRKFKALMHDAPESVLGDVATPLKQLLVDYKVVEARVTAAFARQHSLPEDFEDHVKDIDLRMAATEKRDIMPEGEWAMLRGIEPYHFKVVPWSPAKARAEWLARFLMAFEDHLEGLAEE